MTELQFDNKVWNELSLIIYDTKIYSVRFINKKERLIGIVDLKTISKTHHEENNIFWVRCENVIDI